MATRVGRECDTQVPDSFSAAPIDAFIERWRDSASSERSNSQSFLNELCDAIGVPRPEPAIGGVGDYRFERTVTHYFPDAGSTERRIDLYRRGCFVLESKQGDNPRQHSLFGENEA
ncbi:MAG TPA: type IIL restriction-modification enzyme MmeI [Acetobacteraceae bacterium]